LSLALNLYLISKYRPFSAWRSGKRRIVSFISLPGLSRETRVQPSRLHPARQGGASDA